MTVSQFSITLEGRRAKYWLGGTGKTLVLLHGNLGDARQHWQPTFNALTNQFQILAPDLPGFGVSDPLPMPSYQAYLSWLTGLFEVLNIGGPVLLMGHAFGGTLSRLYTAENTSLVSRLVLVAGGHVIDVGGCSRSLYRLPVLSSLAFTTLKQATYSDTGLRRAFQTEQYLTDDFIQSARAAANGSIDTLRQIGLISAPALRTPTCPTLVVWGEFDRVSSPNAGRRIAAQLPTAKFVLIEQAAHLPQIEQAAAFHAAILPFLNGGESRMVQ